MKEQWIKVTRGSIYAAVAYSVVDAIETSYDGPAGLEEITVPAALLEPQTVLRLAQGGRVRLRVGAPGHEGPLGDPLRLDNGAVVEVYLDPEYLGDALLVDLYSEIPRRTLQLDSTYIREAAAKTASRGGVEYLFVYTDTGSLAALEGDVHQVRIPFVHAILTLHTHPPEACGFSLADAKSAVDLMAEGGLAEAVATTRCIIILRRHGLLSEDDYIAVKSLRGKKSSPFNPARLRLTNLRLEMLYY